jgi:hypothetical protein
MTAVELGQMLMDPGRLVHVPVAYGVAEGWWFQVSRRILLVPRDPPEEPGLVEILAPVGELTLIVTEPILIVARITSHPADWAFVARV